MAVVDLEQGWEALRLRRWDAARSRFLAALDDKDVSAEALEGLSWAAWWLDDRDQVFDARERAYRGYRERGDVAGAARMATWLAIDHLDFDGATAVMSGWLGRASRLLESVEPGPEHGWLAFFEGFVAHSVGETETASRLARSAADLGRRLEVPDLEMLGLALEGLTRVACAEVADGMRCLDEATTMALAGEARIPIAGAWTFCFLVSACTATLDYGRAVEWCDRIAAFAERFGSRYMLAFCRGDYGLIHLWQGRWAEAEAMLVASIEDFARSRPAMTGGPLAGLAELRRRQGRRDEAEALLDRAHGSAPAQLCRARLALDRGDAVAAADLLERLLRQVPPHRRLARAPLLELLVRVRIELGQPAGAAAVAAELREVAHRVGTLASRACADLAEGRVAAARGEHGRARASLEDAVDGLERSGARYETALARLELANSLRSDARGALAAREAARAAAALKELGAVTGSSAPPAGASGPAITPRERDVLALLSGGLTNRQIAERLVVSEHTVHRHVTNLLRKLDQPTRTAAAAYALRTGLVERSPE